MKSPFPGMDPYLERRWSDVHVRLITYITDALVPLLPPNLRALAEERVLLEEVGGRRRYATDVAVVVQSKRRQRAGVRTKGASAATIPEPYVIEFRDGPPVDRFVKIIDTTDGDRVVTAIELLSPGNKASGRLNDDYLRKLDDYVRGDVSVVEIDLIRSSRARLTVTDLDLPPERRAPYMICVQKAWLPGRWEAYPIGLRSAIPPVRIPLRKNDGEVALKLQPLIDKVYSGRGGDIDYSAPLIPPLKGDDAKWAAELIRKATGKTRRRKS
jgi:hypothetical protein